MAKPYQGISNYDGLAFIKGLYVGSDGNEVLVINSSGALVFGGAGSFSSITVTGSSTLATITASGTATFNGNVVLGNASADTLTVNATPTFKAPITFQNSSATTVGSYDANGLWTIGASGGTQSHAINGFLSITNALTPGSASLQLTNTGTNDIVLRYRANSVDYWVTGLDYSDTQAYKISQNSQFGTNDYFSITVSGIVTLGASGSTQSHLVNGDLRAVRRLAAGGGALSSQYLSRLGSQNSQTILSGTTQGAANIAIKLNSAASTIGYGLNIAVDSDNASFTTTDVLGLFVDNPTKGASHTITRWINYGGDPSTAATNNAFIADNTSFTGNWFINSTSSAGSSFTGGVGTPQNLNTGSSGSLTAQPSNAGFLHYTNATAKTLHGIVAPSPAYAMFFIVTNTGGDMTVANESATETTAANRIITSTGADRVFTGDSGMTLVYDPNASRWRVLGTAA